MLISLLLLFIIGFGGVICIIGFFTALVEALWKRRLPKKDLDKFFLWFVPILFLVGYGLICIYRYTSDKYIEMLLEKAQDSTMYKIDQHQNK
ncbi:MAG: hypothetical protein IJ693_00945 [Bacteroidaceae bacterium]|nr:hypothetical protein [Bacteroidaceae bacterium]